MDRDDARFCADVLERRISGAAVELEELRASSLMRLFGAVVRIREVGGDWPPAIVAAGDLEDLARFGVAYVLEHEPSVLLPQFVETMRRLADEPPPPPPNRHARRALVARLPREKRILADRPKLIVPGDSKVFQ